MTAFRDRALLALSDPGALGALLSLAGASGDQRARDGPTWSAVTCRCTSSACTR